MVDYTALNNADLGALRTLIDTWDTVHSKTVDCRRDFDNVTSRLDPDDGWSGDAATAANTRGGELLDLICAGIMESYTIKGILSDAKERFQTAQDDLRAVQATVEGIPELRISGTGNVEIDHAALDATAGASGGDDAPMLTALWEAHRASYQTQIQDAIDAATLADEDVEEALRVAGETGNTEDDSFNGDALGIEDLHAMQDNAARAADLMSTDPPSELSEAELEELNGLLEEYGEHPAFATEFAEELGPDGFIDSYGDLALTMWADNDEDVNDIMVDLQRNLGLTLATATNPESTHVDREWVEGFMDQGLGIQDIDDPSAFLTGSRSVGPYGYEVIAPLLRHGVYHEDFIVPITEHMMRADDSMQPPMWMDVEHVPNPFDPRGGETGHHPLSDALVALDNNPDAAALFFTGGGDYEDMPYSFGPRNLPEIEGSRVDWMLDRVQDNDEGPPVSVNNLGGALESAATGVSPRDEDGIHAPPTEANARVARDLFNYLGDDDHDDAIAGADEELSALNDNVANVTVSYMSDVHNIVGDVSVGSDDELPEWAIPPNENGLLTPDENDDNDSAVSASDMQRLLEAMGHDPGAAMRVAVGSEFNANVQLGATMTQNPDDPGAYAPDTLSGHAAVMGHLNAGDLDQIAADYEEQHSGGVPIADIVSESAKNASGVTVGTLTANPWAGLGAQTVAGPIVDFAIDPFRAEPDPGPGEEMRDASTTSRSIFVDRLDDNIERMLVEQGWNESTDGDVQAEVERIRNVVIERYEGSIVDGRLANGD